MIGKLPHKIKLTSKDVYSVVIVPRFDNKEDLGECDPNNKQIRLTIENVSDKEIVSTLFHETIHQTSFVFDIGLTEDQVLKLEQALPKLFKYNPTFTNIFFRYLVGNGKK